VLRTLAAVSCALGCGRSQPAPAPAAAPAQAPAPPVAAVPAAAPKVALVVRHGDDWDRAATIDRGVAFLAGLYAPATLFDDPYISGCSAPKSGCTEAYRELDHAVLILHWLPASLTADPRLARVTHHARHVEEQWFEHWRAAPLDREALDLYALFPYYFAGDHTDAMVGELVKGLNPAGDWEAYDLHGAPYRKITDELWPVVAIARNHVDDAVLARALDRKRDEAVRVLRGDWKTWPSTERFYTLSHIYLAFTWSERAGTDIARYWPLLEQIEHELAAALDDPELSHSNAALAQALFTLADGGYPDRVVLAKLAAELAARQQPSGRWNAFEVPAGQPIPGRRKPIPQDGFAAAHTTLMALAGLERWARWEPQHAQREWRRLAGPDPITRASTAAPPETVFRDVAGQHIKVAFPITRQADIDFINELRAEPENAVLFFRAGELKDPQAVATYEHAAVLHPSSHGIALQRTPAGFGIQVQLELYGPGATKELADRVARSIERVWQGTVGGTRLATTVHATVRAETAAVSPTALPVFVPSTHVMPSTQRDGDTGDRPTTWPVWMADRTIAHEMGHYFGFADAYHVEVRTGFYYLVYDRPDDIMSSPYGAVQPDQLAQLVRAYGART
jgi:hypothetical protein